MAMALVIVRSFRTWAWCGRGGPGATRFLRPSVRGSRRALPRRSTLPPPALTLRASEQRTSPMRTPPVLETTLEDQLVADAIGDAAEVLDCGCGSGRIARRVRGGHVDGIEQ